MSPFKLPPALGPYAHFVRAGDFIFTSGQIATRADGSLCAEDSVAVQTELALQNLSLVLQSAGSSLEQAVKINIFMTDLSQFDSMNQVYKRFFPQEKYPARCCTQASGLVDGVKIEIDAIAWASRS